MKIFKFTFLFLLLITTCYAENLTLTSVPSDADIVIKDPTSNVISRLGKTPLTRSMDEIVASASTNIFIISVEKNGYASQSLLVTEMPKSEMKLHFNLDPISLSQNNNLLDKSMSSLFEAQRLLRGQQFDEAITLLKKTEEDLNQLSIVPEMIGGAYYLKKDIKSALTWYQKAYRLNPNNKDAFNMKNYLEKALGKTNE